MLGLIGKWARAEEGAIAPTAALSLFALIAAGGIAFDYARLAAMDTELQQAADQAALAAATQLDGGTNAMARAEAAARNLLTNQTRFANDGAGVGVAVAAGVAGAADQPVKFYATRTDAETDTNGWFSTSSSPTANSAARFVRIAIAARRANYAMTPVVGVFTSGDINAQATAGLGSAICKVPPVMMCNPDEPVGNADENLRFIPTPGVGLRLVTGNATVPGNFGWLESGLGNGTPELAAALGYNSPPGECQEITGVETKTGMDTAVLNAFNTRFDVFANGNTTCPNQGGGVCSPALNTRKDLTCSSNDGTQCTNDSWSWSSSDSYQLPTTTVCTRTNNNGVCTQTAQVPQATTLPTDGSRDPLTMAFTKDICHSLPRNQNGCGGAGIKGNGAWDRDAFFRVNYGWSGTEWPTRTGLTAATGSAGVTRWQVYNWEIANPLINPATGTACAAGATGCRGIAQPRALGGNKYNFSQPATGRAGVAAGPTQADRRKFSVAVINCRALNINGKTSGIPVPTWLEVFLVEPAVDRTDNGGGGSVQYTDQKDIYVEAIGETLASGAGGVGQVVRRDVPYLIR